MGLLSWLSGGRKSTESSVRSAPVQAEAAPAAPRAVPAWSELPPVQRALAAPGLVSDPIGFRSSLSAWQDTSFHKPLGHFVSPEAPSGLGHGLTSAFTVSREADEHSAPEESVSRTSGPTAPVPLQRDTRSVSLASARPLQTSLQELPQLTVASPPHATGSTNTGSVDTSMPPAAPVQRSVQPEATVLPEASVQSRTPSPSSEPPRSRGLGLGEPLHSLPPTAQRTAAADSPRLEPSLNSPASEGSSESGRTESEVFDSPSRPLLGDDPLTTVSRTDDSDPGAETETSPAKVEQSPAPPVVHDPVPLQRASEDGTPLPRLPAPPPEPVVAPLVAQRSVPLFSRAEAPADSAPAATPDAASPTVPVRWTAPDSPDTGRPHTTSPDAGSSSSPAPPAPVQRTVTPTPVRSTAPAPVVTTTRPVQRTTATSPLTTPSHPSASPSHVDAGAVAVASGVAQRMADGSVVFRSPTVQRDADTDTPATDTAAEPPPPSDTPAEPVDPPPEPDPEPPPEPGADPADQPGTSDAHGPQGAHPGKGGAPKVTDELVRALFGPLSRMLKAELRLDRERAGFLIDTRH